MPDSSTQSEGATDQTPSEEVSLFVGNRKRLLDWLDSKSPIICELYKSAVMNLYSNPPKSGWSILVPYVVREITNKLPNHVADLEVSDRGLNREDEVKRIIKIWKDRNLDSTMASQNQESPPTSTDSADAVIPREIFTVLSDLVRDDSDIQNRTLRKAHRLFKVIMPESDIQEHNPVVSEWQKVTKWFSKDGKFHVSDKEKNVTGDINEYKANFERMEDILLGAIQGQSNFSDTLNELNDIITHANR